MASASSSLLAAASELAVAASNTCTPGEVSISTCMSMPLESMSAMRLGPRSCSRSTMKRARSLGLSR
jgi:hypothetical protein